MNQAKALNQRIERDQRLHAAQGLCYHQRDCCPDKDCDGITYTCEICGETFFQKYRAPSIQINDDYSSWDGFGKLMLFIEANHSTWGEKFVSEHFNGEGNWTAEKVRPDALADALDKFLSAK